MSVTDATAPREPAPDAAARFVERLEELVPDPDRPDRGDAGDRAGARRGRDRAALAALRQALRREPAEVPDAWRYVDPRLPRRLSPEDEAAYYLVAALFGWHPEHRAGKNLGGSFAELAAAQRAVGLEPTGVERRFVALLDTDRDDLAAHLRQAVGLLRSHAIPLDYAQLLRDLLWWDRSRRTRRRSVQRDWAWAFWGGARGAEEASAPSDEESPAPPAPPDAPAG